MTTPIPNIPQDTGAGQGNIANTPGNTHHYNATPNPNFDPNNPPEFSPNTKGTAPQVQKQAISGLGIILIIIGIIFLGVLIGKVISMFVNAGGGGNQATTQSVGGCTTIDCCHQQGRCMAVSESDPYACKTITECVTCDPATCSYTTVDTTKCAGKPCGPTPLPSESATPTPPPPGSGICEFENNTPVCLGNNFSGKCVDKIINGKPYACQELVGDYGLAIKGATDPHNRPKCTCPEPYTWMNYEYGRWWCFDTHSPGVCIPNNNTRYSCKPGTCESSTTPTPTPTPTGTIVETPTPSTTNTPTPTPSVTETPTPTQTPTPTNTSTPTTTTSPVPTTGIMDSPIALGSVFFIVSLIALYELLTGTITNKLLAAKASATYSTTPNKLKFIIRIDNIKKTRQEIEEKVKNDINSDE